MSPADHAPLKDLVVKEAGAAVQQRGERVWSLSLDQIESGTGRVISKLRIPAGDLGPSTHYFSPGTVLYSKLRPYLNKAVIADESGFATTELVSLHCDRKKITPEYLWHYLRSPRFVAFASAAVAGAKMPRMVMGEFWNHKVPLPPITEQQRISAILDKAESLRAKRQEAIDELGRLVQAIFIEIFGDSINNPMKWDDSLCLGDVADIVSGITKGRKLNGKKARSVPYLAVSNVQDMRLNLNNVKVIEATEDEIRRYVLQSGDLLLTEGGDPDKLGRGTLWGGELPECIHQNHVFRVRATSERITPCFLNWLIGSARGKRYFFSSAKQTTGIASINMTQLRNFPLLLPPIQVQERFEKILSRVRQQNGKLLQAYRQNEDVLTSIQHRAFQGTL